MKKFYQTLRTSHATLTLLMMGILLLTANLSNGQTLTIDKLDYAPGETVIITGTNWQPGEEVSLMIMNLTYVELNTLPYYAEWFVTADSLGNFSSWWNVTENELNTELVLTALGQESGYEEQVFFTDASNKVINLTVGAQNETLNYGTVGSTSFDLKLEPDGGSAEETANLSIDDSNFPAGVTATLPSSVTLPKKSDDLITVTLTIQTSVASNAGTYEFTITASGGSGGNAWSESNTGTLVISKATPFATLSVTNSPVTYNGSPQLATVSISASSVPGSVSNIQYNGLSTNPTNAATYAVTADFVPDDVSNYNTVIGLSAGNFVISKADAVILVTPYNVTYDATAHTATGSATGVEGEALVGLDLTGTTHTDAGNYPTDQWSFTDVTGNYNDTSGTVHDVISKADADVTVNGYTGVYDAAAHGATGTATGVGNVDLSAGLNLGDSFTDVPGGTASWSFEGGTNYLDENGSIEIVITKADADVAVNGYTGVYDAADHGATGTATGVGGVDLSAGLNLGDSFTDAGNHTANWSFTGGTNYNDLSGSVAIDISKADAVVTVSGWSGTYDAAAHGATGSFTGVALDPTAAGASLDLGDSFTDVPGGTASWSFEGGTNYLDENGTVEIVITKADADVTVNGYTGVYDAAAHGATGTVTGVGGVDLSAGLNLGDSFTDVPGGIASWSFEGGTNYLDENGSIEIVITKADADVAVNGYTGVYDAAAHGATGTATGVGGVDLSAVLNLGASFTDVPGGTASWSFSGGTNYLDENGTVEIVITKADADVAVNGYTGVYDAAAHGATGTATGVGGVDLSAGLNLGDSFTDVPGGTASWSFSGGTNYLDESGSVEIVISQADADVTVTGYTGVYDAAAHGATGSFTGVAGDPTAVGASLDLGLSFTDVPGGTANWSFEGGTNYLDESGSVEIVISQADADVTVTGYTGVYDAAAHGATGSFTGVAGDPTAVGASLDLGLSFTDVPGGTANWSFEGGTNYLDESGSVEIVISQADADVTVPGYTGVYDAAAHGATGSFTGVAGDPTAVGASLDLGLSFTDVPGGTADWTFSGGTNYLDESGSVDIIINPATASIVVNGYSGTYNAAAHGATLGSATGVGGADLSASVTIAPTTYTDYPGGPVAWSFTNNNYVPQSGSVNIDIAKADALVTVSGYTGTYDATAHGATGSFTGVAGDPTAVGASLDLGDSFTDVPGGTANWSFEGGTNYLDESGSVEIVITKADADVAVNGYTGVYDALSHGATGTATGVGGVDLSAGLNLGDSFTDVPGGTADWTFDGGINYENESGSVQIVITKADADVAVNGYTGVYDALAHGATGTATGVGGVDLSAGLNLGDSFTDVPGGTADWTFDGGINYENESGSVQIVITKADADVAVNGYTGVYDALAHGATGTATGVGGVDLSAGLNLGDSFTDVPGGTADWTFDGGINYENESGSVQIVITKADADVAVNGYTGVYDALAHGATGTATGVGGVDLSAGLNLGDSFTDVPGGTADWTFDGGINYENESGSVQIVITKADADVAVNGYTGVYDALAHGATGTATGVGGVDLSAGLNLGDSFTDVPGGTADWTFDGGINYENESGSVQIVITKADADVAVNGYTGIYDALSHGATGTATGVGGVDLSAGLNLGDSFTDVPGGTADWTFDGGINYENESGSVQIVITKADADVAVNGYTGVYDAMAHGATGTATGVGGVDLSAGLNLGDSFTDVPGGTANWSFEGGTNYNDQSGSVPIVITKKAASVSPMANGKYCGQPDPTFDGTLDGFVASDNVIANYSRTEGETVNGSPYTISAILSPVGILSNYNITYNTAEFIIDSVTIDASASSTPVALGETATLSATVVNESLVPVQNVEVTFVVTYYEENNSEQTQFTGSASTDINGIASIDNISVPDVKVYKVTAIAGEGCSESVAYLPVYDPSAGFVTGGGWIMSPAGAYLADPDLTGKANFGFVAKYKKGKSDVEGNTEFHFHAAGMKFKSQFHESGSLVISGGKATYRGEGTINGEGSYKFTLVAFDGDWNDGTESDRFRIKIWGDTGIVYDNAMDTDDNSDDATKLGGGSIVIHEVKSNKKTKSGFIEPTEELEPVEPKLKIYPNPFKDRARFEFASPIATQAKIDIYNMAGQMVQTVFDGFVEKNTTYNADFKPDEQVSGIYFYRMKLGNVIHNGKLVYKKD